MTLSTDSAAPLLLGIANNVVRRQWRSQRRYRDTLERVRNVGQAEVHLEAWDPDGPASGPKTHPRYFTDRQLSSGGNAMPALVPTLKEVWTSPDGTTREREALGRVDFLADADQTRWEEAGSPPPFAYDPAEHEVGRDGLRAAPERFFIQGIPGSP